MMYNQDQISITIPDKVIRSIHLIMLYLCVVATIALFVIESQPCKIMLSILLCSYGIFLMVNPQIFKLVFQINDNKRLIIASKDYLIPPKRRLQQTSVTKIAKLEEECKLYKNSSLDRILDQTYRSQRSNIYTSEPSMNMTNRYSSTSLLSQSRLSQHHMRETNERKGYDLMALTQRFAQKYQDLSKSSISSQDKSRGIVLLSRKEIARQYIERNKIENDELYENQLQNQINKTKRQVQSRYKVILNQIHFLIKPIINEHKFINTRLKQLSLDFLDITLTDEKSHDLDLSLAETMHRRSSKALPEQISFQVLVYKLFKLHLRKSTPSDINLPLKSHRSWNDFLARIKQLFHNRIKLGQILGVQHLHVESKYIEVMQKFTMQYNYYISLLHRYMKSDLNPNKMFDNQIDDFAEQDITQLYKSRIYVVYLFTNNLNENLKPACQIELKDYLNFKHPQYSRVQFQIYPKYAYDSLIPYFNLYKVQEGRRTKVYYCEYGETNYLSIIYFLMHCLSEKSQLLSWNQYINKMVREIL